MVGALARKVIFVGLMFLLVTWCAVLRAEATEPDPYFGQCVFAYPQTPNYYVDDYDESIDWGTANTYFNLVWNGESINTLTPVANLDSQERPYWETGGYRYTRGALVDYSEGVHAYQICKTTAGVLAPIPSPLSLTVPAASVTGPRWSNGSWVEGYTVFWGNSISGATYRLEEATDINFTTGLRTVVSGTTALSAAITGRTAGFTYYYRVRAEKNGEVSGWVDAGNGCVVSEGDGWSTWWSAGAYTDNLTRSDFPTERPLNMRIFYQDGSTWEGNLPDSYYYEGSPGTWELTINGNSFDYYEGGDTFNRIDVRLGTPPDAPASINVPPDSDNGCYTVSWTASATSGVTFELQEATNSGFTTGLRTVVSDTNALSAAICGRPGGFTYYYRLRAKKDGAFSDWLNASNGCTVALDPFFGQCVNVWPQTPNYYVDDYDESIDWGTANRYFNLVWNNEPLYALTPVADVDIQNRPYWETGGYRYTRGALVRYSEGVHEYQICKTTAGEPAPLSNPLSLTVPASSVAGLRWVNGSWVEGYTVFWGNSISGATYRLEEATNSSFTTGLRTVISGTTALSAAISGRTAGTSYYYRVRAEKNGEVSDLVNSGNGCAVFEGDGWSTWWSGAYTDTLTRSDFPPERPLNIRIFYQDGEVWEGSLPDSYYYEGSPGTWELTIDGNDFDYYEGGDIFNRINVKLAN